MFKKLKDKLAEEVKSSPQRIQQFAQAAQAAVTSASSSISDITNSDLFSIGDNDGQPGQQGRSTKLQSPSNAKGTFQDVALVQAGSSQASIESEDFAPNHDIIENQRQRRLSNSSYASDVSFRLPSYESPSMYHLQSDMEVSASEAEERGFSSGTVSLDRVTKEQIYAAYRRTQERYTKYRTQYADLARHYKLLERENAKARSVLVETQDKALRRISELREQCNLEQSAKAHLEKALRVDIEEKNMKIDTLNTKITLLQSNGQNTNSLNINSTGGSESDSQLINLSIDNENNQTSKDHSTSEVTNLNNKIEKLEQLVNKYKESLKATKEKNTQITTELQILISDLDNKNKENDQLKVTAFQLTEAQKKNQELNDLNEDLQNKLNSLDFNKVKEISTLEIDLQKALEEITQLKSKINVFTKREEEYAISLAENKLSIHKELESKENEIKSLKDSLSASLKEIQSLNIVVEDYKNNISLLEEERSKMLNDINELNLTKTRLSDLEAQQQELSQKCQTLEASKTKSIEEYKCLQLQLKQETAEKLAMIDRNVYLENRNTQLSEENARKKLQLNNLESELQKLKTDKQNISQDEITDKRKMLEEIDIWKNNYRDLESEIQEERIELVKLQSEIEKLLTNHESIQMRNTELKTIISELKSENTALETKFLQRGKMKASFERITHQIKNLREMISVISQESKLLKNLNNDSVLKLKENINDIFNLVPPTDEVESMKNAYEDLKKDYNTSQTQLKKITEQYSNISNEFNIIKKENHKIKSEIEALEKEKESFKEKMEDIKLQYENSSEQLMVLRKENQTLAETIKNHTERCIILEQENKMVCEKLKSMDSNNIHLSKELDNLNNEHDDALSKLKETTKELISKSKKTDDSLLVIDKLQKDIQDLTQENMLLKSQSEMIADNVKVLESELSDVRKSHTEIENEKNRLNMIIEKLERIQHENHHTDQETQTNVFVTTSQQSTPALDSSDHEGETEFKETIEKRTENKILTDDSGQLSSIQWLNDERKNILNDDLKPANNLTDEHDYLKEEHTVLKEENRRLHSDIAGLQTYLTKISKENSVLNDKLRELFASSENCQDKTEIISNYSSDFKGETLSGNEKIENLLRENTLLIEENLELKDQLKSQNYDKQSESKQYDNEKKFEYNVLKEKYNNLIETNRNIEQKMVDFEHMNKTLNSNMLHIQGNNEKLRLTNEKLERRLDEALVSLRHLHSLQENTELEYLRNILYEYLTGSGTHSLTLAKVLAAVVKFDDTQTQQVLQKEKERQGILRQLGLI